MKNIYRFCIILVLFFSPMVLFAEVTATYLRESAITLDISPGPFTHPTVLGAKLGTFVITSTNGEIYSPSLVNIGEASGQIPLTGLMKDWADGPFVLNTNDFYIISVAYPNGLGSEPVLQVLYNNVRPIISWNSNTVYANPFYVELYLVNTNSTNRNAQSGWRPASYFKLDSPYSLPVGFNPLFSVAVADSPNTNVGTYTTGSGSVKESQGSYVTTDGSSGPDNTQILDPGSYTNPDDPDTPGFYYGEVPVTESFFIDFLIPELNFELSDAYGSNRVTINEARIEVMNGTQGTNYTQLFTFTDQSQASSFQLFPSAGSGSPIDFNLYLENDLIEKGTAYTWSGLQPGILNTRNIRIGGISETEVMNRVSGTYTDTITVTITNPD
jgi:spore coat protein U-like protein